MTARCLLVSGRMVPGSIAISSYQLAPHHLNTLTARAAKTLFASNHAEQPAAAYAALELTPTDAR
jgi:hypothetical protein